MRSIGGVVVLLVLAGITIGAWLLPTDYFASRPSANGATTVSLDPRPTLASQPLEALTDLVERPPFAANRRALDPANDDPTLILGRYRLSGVVVAPGKRAVMLSGPEGSRTVAEGETIDGWTVDRVDPERVILVTGDRRQEIPVAPRDR